MYGQSEQPPLFTKREKYALAVLTLSFIVASALVHLILGGYGSSLFPHFRPEAAASLQPIIFEKFAMPTPTPQPVPTPHVIATAVPHEQPTSGPPERRPVHPPHPSATGTRGPQTNRTPAPGPPVIAPPTAQPIVAPSAVPATAPVPEQITESQFIRRAAPEYPQIAIDENIQGTVTVRVTIGPEGQVEEAVVVQSSGNSLLDNAAVKAARESAFRAPLRDGNPTTREYLIVYTFSLDAQ